MQIYDKCVTPLIRKLRPFPTHIDQQKTNSWLKWIKYLVAITDSAEQGKTWFILCETGFGV